MTEFRWGTPATFTALTLSSDLQTLANNTALRLAATIDNTTPGYQAIYLKLTLGSFTPGSNALVRAALVPKLDGTTVTIGTALMPVGTGAMRYAGCDLSTTAEVKTLDFVFESCHSMVYNIVIQNATGTTFAASGHSLSWSGSRIATV